MKNMKLNIGKSLLLLSLPLFGGVGGSLTSCADMLEPESDLVMYENENQLSTVNDTLYSVMGVVRLMQNVADRTNILGEVRGDLTKVTNDASEDLKSLANFTADENNAYNRPQDYYAIINNCNYFILHADSAYTHQGTSIFNEELAAMHSFRAWAYLQLCLNYGSVPFYTDFIGSLSEAEEIVKQPKKDVKEICNYLIEDLKKWQNVKPLSYGAFNDYYSSEFFIPVRLMLGELCLWADRYQEAAMYYHDYLNDRDYPHPLWNYGITWDKHTRPLDQYGPSGALSMSYLTGIPMQLNSFDGPISHLIDLYCSTENNYNRYELTYSRAAVELSNSQLHWYVYEDDTDQRDTLCMNREVLWRDELLNGDLRLYMGVSNGVRDEVPNDMYSKEVQTVLIHHKSSGDKTSEVVLYRLPAVYLHFAEALNRAGYPTSAFAVLKYGICDDNFKTMDSTLINFDEIAAAGDLVKFDPLYFKNSTTDRVDNFGSNIRGVHSRGCGDSAADPSYRIPLCSTKADTIQWVEDKIVEELALETIFDGQRYYDLMRVALRRDDPSYLANRIAMRNGKDNIDTELQSRLTKTINWYLPMRK